MVPRSKLTLCDFHEKRYEEDIDFFMFLLYYIIILFQFSMKKLLTNTKNKIITLLDKHTSQIFDLDDGKFKNIPRCVLWLLYIMSMSVLIQGFFDIILKILGYTPLLVQLPWRVDFLFLTGISILMGYQALIGMRRRELDVTKNSIQIGILVEVALVVGDIYFVIQNIDIFPSVLAIRAPFIVLTFINIIIFGYVSSFLDIFKDEHGNWNYI